MKKFDRAELDEQITVAQSDMWCGGTRATEFAAALALALAVVDAAAELAGEPRQTTPARIKMLMLVIEDTVKACVEKGLTK